ncbi:alpha 1,2 mannosyltransferase [Actinomortierella ambigua]|uniref:Mannosyltransferase n=1 Tax=Actinomortierella ambigua TaxID=1343610 RepID=A0A9P6Q2T4_9FUNG|nr:alpha 1,2 mannosyltransferase [Actinomortierella ambigua]
MTDTRTFRPLSKATWGIYLLFVAIRVFVAFQPGYIHPDEYFQNAEITAGKLFNLSVNTPWEYLPQNPCRSILAPAITTGIPYAILKATLGTHPGKDFFLDRFRDSGIVLGVSINIVLDSLFFGKLTIVHAATQQPIASWTEVLDPFAWRDLQFQGTLTVTFLNNLLYNLDKDNLAQHGLHPRYLHLLVNFPVLFANLAYVGVKAIGEKIFAQKQCVSQSTLVTALAYSGISGILLLSVMPHQEARFLTPLLIPLVLTTASRVSKLGRKFWPLWLVYNGVLAIVFGTFHQAGVTPAIAELQTQALGITNCQTIPLRSGSTSSHVGCDTNTSPKGIYHLNRNGNETYITHTIYYKTYMPPYHLYGLNEQDAENHGIKLEISDWRTKDREELIKALSEIPAAKDPNHRLLIEEAFVENPNKALFFESAPGIYWRNVLIAPSTVDLSDQPFYNTRLSFTPHANLDHMDVILQRPFSSFSMNIYYI